jgi:hypothetical protein
MPAPRVGDSPVRFRPWANSRGDAGISAKSRAGRDLAPAPPCPPWSRPFRAREPSAPAYLALRVPAVLSAFHVEQPADRSYLFTAAPRIPLPLPPARLPALALPCRGFFYRLPRPTHCRHDVARHGREFLLSGSGGFGSSQKGALRSCPWSVTTAQGRRPPHASSMPPAGKSRAGRLLPFGSPCPPWSRHQSLEGCRAREPVWPYDPSSVPCLPSGDMISAGILTWPRATPGPFCGCVSTWNAVSTVPMYLMRTRIQLPTPCAGVRWPRLLWALGLFHVRVPSALYGSQTIHRPSRRRTFWERPAPALADRSILG